MIDIVKIKYYLQIAFMQIIRFIIRKRYILFEDWNYCSDSPRKVFEEMTRRRLSRKYQFVCVCFDNYDLKNLPDTFVSNSIFINPAIHPALYRFYQYLTSACISCDRRICDFQHKNTVTNFYIMHGSPVKDTHKYYHISPLFERVICAAKSMKELRTYP